jgi:CRISPR-associated protein Cas2
MTAARRSISAAGLFMKYTIAFDITDDRVRYRAVKILLEYGYRVQKSVFEGILSLESAAECRERLAKIIDAKLDSVRIYPFCGQCESKIAIMGIGRVVEKKEYIIL